MVGLRNVFAMRWDEIYYKSDCMWWVVLRFTWWVGGFRQGEGDLVKVMIMVRAVNMIMMITKL